MGRSVVVERESKESNTPSCRPECTKTAKNSSFAHFLAYKLPKTQFFAQKYLTRYTPKTFFEEYINFKIFSYLRHCGVIHVQSFGSHTPPPAQIRVIPVSKEFSKS
jgi:hypothetical protein